MDVKLFLLNFDKTASAIFEKSTNTFQAGCNTVRGWGVKRPWLWWLLVQFAIHWTVGVLTLYCLSAILHVDQLSVHNFTVLYPALVSLKTTTNLGEGSALLSSCRIIQIQRALLLLLTNVRCVGNHHDNTDKTISKLISFIDNLVWLLDYSLVLLKLFDLSFYLIRWMKFY